MGTERKRQVVRPSASQQWGPTHEGPVVTIPLKGIQTELQGFAVLAAAYKKASTAEQTDIVLDFTKVGWCDANMAATLGALRAALLASGKRVRFWNVARQIERVFEKNGFFETQRSDTFKTTIPYKRFGIEDAIPFAVYVDEHLRGKGIPKMSEQLRRKFLEGVDELFGNAAIHSKSAAGVFCCGQMYPKRARLDFTIVDVGVGFMENIRQRLGLSFRPEAAIDWALQGRNTTRVLDIPGGLGLKIIREFIEMNGGKLMIVSDAGYWCLNQQRIKRHRLPHRFPGTAITLEIQTSDEAEYYLTGEIDPHSIF
jgi:anti-anti-sigma regulatory factor